MSMGQLVALLLGLVIVTGAAVLVVRPTLAGAADGGLDERLQTYAAVPLASPQPVGRRGRPWLGRLRLRLNLVLSALASENLNLQLARASWPISVQEYVLITLGGMLIGATLGWALAGSPLPGLGLGILAYLLPGFLLRRDVNRRQTAFARQLVDVLVLLSGAVRAGYSLLQAMEVVVREMKAPAADEFARVVRDVGLGLRLPVALRNLAQRMQHDDLDLVVTSIDIQYQVGGNMAAILDSVTETIRERTRLFGEIRVLTTQQRYSSYLLTLLPVVVAAFLFLLNPIYMQRLFEPNAICFPIGAVIGIVLGNIAIQRIARIDV